MSKTTHVLVLILFFATAMRSVEAQAPYLLNGVYDYDKARQVMTYINRLRLNQGLSPLKMDAALTEAGMLRAAEFAFRSEESDGLDIPYEYAKRPNGKGNLVLIGEQRHTPQPKVEFYYLRLTRNRFTDIGTVVGTMRKSPNGEAAFFSKSMHSFGCGSFISSQGFHYWVLFLMPDAGTGGEIPKGQDNVEVSIALNPDGQTKTVSRKSAEGDLTPTSFKVAGRFDYGKAIQVVELTNKERVTKGLKPLVMDSTLMELAMIRAAEMKGINKMTHTRPNGGSGVDIILNNLGISASSGENIALGQSTAQIVMAQWMGSPGHRANILNRYYTHMGAGECNGYWVQLFMDSPKGTTKFSKSSGRIDNVVVMVTLVEEKESKIVKRERGAKK